MKSGQIRIIGGQFKRRKLSFPSAISGLRPTTDRIRETLFNWLAAHIKETICIDAFAGSGALGFEALSQGAKSCLFIEQNTTVFRVIQNNIALLKLNNAQVLKQNALSYLALVRQVDILFLDPPFHQGLLIKALGIIAKNSNITGDTLIYAEAEKGFDFHELQTFEIYKFSTAGDVVFALLRKLDTSFEGK